ncbi:uncharacterized protein LOC131336489 isoform X4 [Rhododendron vialii]|uniref:uncharacterized protein LOC131336489 isoform X4 n=1 Tax=Rhododendron vialii TaxID=182163 RepID=UPI00265DE730|nr:uncharacterized protein LOC131336489 isoform X4 [Rhododendron vialii]
MERVFTGNYVNPTIQVAWLAPHVCVPSDEDSVAEKRKGEELVVPEGNKKKKKQVNTPRPACSWVHFSREFIKEYSASHPESSGLKAATKAASDAWKSMSVEEKAKYTRRAREVWDNYLSTAPARVSKPRRQLFYYERISVGGPRELVPTVVPCLSSWGEEEISEREKREKELGGYGRGEVIYKERSQSMELVVADGAQQDGTPVGEVGTIVEHDLGFADDVAPANEDKVNGETTTEKENIQVDLEKGNIICVDMGVVVEPVRGPCRNTEYGCPEESVTHTGKNDHEETCIYAPCSCPLQNCAFIGSSEQLSLHFSSKHQDSGRRFQYNCPLPLSLNDDDQFLVLQAEDDGLLFLLNKGVETIGHTLMVNRIGPSSSKEGFFYDLVSEKGTSSLRLKSCVQSFPGLVIGLPPVDFLLIPFGYASSSGQLSLEVCIWNSTELGAD